ncbi:hypothetical protein [Henriciella aquimarina]|uniref:hypothetical protein n=1 Tax=Henriciella aquimarina TaxID=545261 RepID=UPI000A058C64|nr:hypothetical protein [Henriciella aquimarina]
MVWRKIGRLCSLLLRAMWKKGMRGLYALCALAVIVGSAWSHAQETADGSVAEGYPPLTRAAYKPFVHGAAITTRPGDKAFCDTVLGFLNDQRARGELATDVPSGLVGGEPVVWTDLSVEDNIQKILDGAYNGRCPQADRHCRGRRDETLCATVSPSARFQKTSLDVDRDGEPETLYRYLFQRADLSGRDETRTNVISFIGPEPRAGASAVVNRHLRGQAAGPPK